MTDRELLEWAYKAYAPNGNYIRMVNDAGYNYWDPITDDGAAFSLMVKLRIEVRHFDSGFVEARKFAFGPCREDYGRDADAATRRAIVRAAAEIGKAMI